MVVDSHVTDELDQLNKIMKKTRLDREKKSEQMSRVEKTMLQYWNTIQSVKTKPKN